MRLKGRVVPDIIEVPRGNGITELVPVERTQHTDPEPGLQWFQWEKPRVEVEVVKKRNNRNWIGGSVIAAAFMLGSSLGGMIQRMDYCAPVFVASLAWIALVAWVNR